MSGASVTSSDLDFARRLSHECSSQSCANLTSSGVAYVRFPTPGTRASVTMPREADAPDPEAASEPAVVVARPSLSTPRCVLDSEATQDWESFSRWCRQTCAANVVFVVDGQGFVVAHDGEVPLAELEGAGAEIAVALDQCSAIGVAGRLRALTLHTERGQLWAVANGSSAPTVLALVCPDRLADDVASLLLSRWTDVASTLFCAA
jgi:hypothetical protein